MHFLPHCGGKADKGGRSICHASLGAQGFEGIGRVYCMQQIIRYHCVKHIAIEPYAKPIKEMAHGLGIKQHLAYGLIFQHRLKGKKHLFSAEPHIKKGSSSKGYLILFFGAYRHAKPFSQCHSHRVRPAYSRHHGIKPGLVGYLYGAYLYFLGLRHRGITLGQALDKAAQFPCIHGRNSPSHGGRRKSTILKANAYRRIGIDGAQGIAHAG